MLRLPTWSLRVYLFPTTPIPTTKDLASVGPPPIGAAGESLPVPQGWPCPDAGPVSAAAQRDPSGCREPSSRTPRGPSTRDKQTPGRHRRARGDTASSRDLKGSERRRDPCRPFSADPSATRDARKRLGSSAQNRFLSLRRREHPAGTHFFLVFLRLPPRPTESRTSNRSGCDAASRRGVPPPDREHSFSCPSTDPGRRPGGSPGAATRLRRRR